MTDEERDEQTEEKPEEQAEEQAAEPAPAEEPKAEEPKDEAPKEDEAPAADAEEAPAEEPAAEGADEPPAAEGEEAPADDEGMDWKARRRLERSRRPAEARPQRSPEDRAAERTQRRASAGKARTAYRRKRREKHEPGTGSAPADRESVARKIRQGRVVSDKADKTITIRIDVAHRHPTYEKIVRTSNTLHVHDERNEAGEGDLVRVVETRPLSRTKRWRLIEVLEKAK
jgi:small subunit ribosomal protein S17